MKALLVGVWCISSVGDDWSSGVWSSIRSSEWSGSNWCVGDSSEWMSDDAWVGGQVLARHERL
jgi:hypothetical protein